MGGLFQASKAFVKLLIRSTCAEFSFSRIHVVDLCAMPRADDARVREVTIDDIAASPCVEIAGRSNENYARAILYGIWQEGALAGYLACFPANAYQDIALPQGLQGDEVLVNRFLIAPQMRNRNLGSALLHGAFRQLARRGYRRAYAVVWHNNWSSIRAFHKAGTMLDHSIVVVRSRLWPRPFHFRFSTNGPRVRKVLAAPVPKGARLP
jgi:GNAT superfamily N-acetyltransferase